MFQTKETEEFIDLAGSNWSVGLPLIGILVHRRLPPPPVAHYTGGIEW